MSIINALIRNNLIRIHKIGIKYINLPFHLNYPVFLASFKLHNVFSSIKCILNLRSFENFCQWLTQNERQISCHSRTFFYSWCTCMHLRVPQQFWHFTCSGEVSKVSPFWLISRSSFFFCILSTVWILSYLLTSCSEQSAFKRFIIELLPNTY